MKILIPFYYILMPPKISKCCLTFIAGKRGGIQSWDFEVIRPFGFRQRNTRIVRQWWQTTHPYIASPIQGRPKLDPPIFETQGKHPKQWRNPKVWQPSTGFLPSTTHPVFTWKPNFVVKACGKVKRLVVGHQSSLEGSQGMSPKTNSGKTKCPKILRSNFGPAGGILAPTLISWISSWIWNNSFGGTPMPNH